jgi:hypothetical protein
MGNGDARELELALSDSGEGTSRVSASKDLH